MRLAEFHRRRKIMSRRVVTFSFRPLFLSFSFSRRHNTSGHFLSRDRQILFQWKWRECEKWVDISRLRQNEVRLCAIPEKKCWEWPFQPSISNADIGELLLLSRKFPRITKPSLTIPKLRHFWGKYWMLQQGSLKTAIILGRPVVGGSSDIRGHFPLLPPEMKWASFLGDLVSGKCFGFFFGEDNS